MSGHLLKSERKRHRSDLAKERGLLCNTKRRLDSSTSKVNYLETRLHQLQLAFELLDRDLVNCKQNLSDVKEQCDQSRTNERNNRVAAVNGVVDKMKKLQNEIKTLKSTHDGAMQEANQYSDKLQKEIIALKSTHNQAMKEAMKEAKEISTSLKTTHKQAMNAAMKEATALKAIHIQAMKEAKELSLSTLCKQKEKALAELVREKKSLSIVLQQEKQRSLYDIEQESQISLSEIKAIEEKHNNSIARERKHRNTAIEFNLLKSSKKVEHYKALASDLLSTSKKQETAIWLEERAITNEKLDRQQKRHDKEVSDLRESMVQRLSKVRDGHAVSRQKYIDTKTKAISSLKSELKTRTASVHNQVDIAVSTGTNDLAINLHAANKEIRRLNKLLTRTKSLSTTRLIRERSMKMMHDQLQQEYLKLKDCNATILCSLARYEKNSNDEMGMLHMIKKERPIGRRGGRSRWPPHIVQLICEQLVNGTPPSAIPANIVTMFAINGIILDEVPSVNYCRQCRTVVQVIVETLAVKRLADAESWDQGFFDASSRRQVSFTCFVVGLKNANNTLETFTLSSCIFSEDETAEKQVESIINSVSDSWFLLFHYKLICYGKTSHYYSISQLNFCAARLKKWSDVYEREYGEADHGIPHPSNVHIGKLGGNATTTDICNTAQKKEQCLLGEEVAKRSENGRGTYKVPCWQHLRNIWFGAGTKAPLSIHMTTFLKDHLDIIDSRLRVGTSSEACQRAIEKNFGLTNNYAKGEGEVFHPHMKKCHPGALLFNLERVSGSRQDIAVEGACAVYWNRPYYVEFLFDRLSVNDSDNILRENLWIILTSKEMVAMFRTLSIAHISIRIQVRWSAANTHKLAEYNWSPLSMGRVIDILEDVFEKVINKSESVLDEEFMMGIFQDLRHELPPFDDFLVHKFEKQQTKVVGDSKATVVPFSLLRSELFSPEQETNQETDDVTKEYGIILMTAMLKELRDPHKVTSNYLSSTGSEYAWEHKSPNDHDALKGKMAVNDPSERNFGSGTRELQVYGRIDLSSAFAIGQAKTNGDMSRKLNIGKKSREETENGFFYNLDANPDRARKLRNSLIIMATEDSPSTSDWNISLLTVQRAAREWK